MSVPFGEPSSIGGELRFGDQLGEATPAEIARQPGGERTRTYIADFTLISKRALTDLEQKLFRYHFLLGADWKLCSRQLHIDRGNFFHAVYRIEQKLGRVFRELQPYPLYPLDEYFHGASRFTPVKPAPVALNPFSIVPPRLQFPMPLSA